MSYDVFISYKHTTGDTKLSRDYQLANEIYGLLTSRGVGAFFSSQTLEATGVAEYKKTIDEALETATVLIVVGTSSANLSSDWVRYEWDSFLTDIIGGFKQNGKVFCYVEGVTLQSLPWGLRHVQVFQHGAKSLDTLYNFIATALGREVASEVEWLFSVRYSIQMLNADLSDRLALELTGANMSWMGLIAALTLEAWNAGHCIVDIDDMRIEILKRETHNIDERTFEAAVHTFCIPTTPSGRNPLHYLLYTPMPHLRAINQPMLFRSWYAEMAATIRELFPLQQAPRPIVGQHEKSWCEWLEARLSS